MVVSLQSRTDNASYYTNNMYMHILGAPSCRRHCILTKRLILTRLSLISLTGCKLEEAELDIDLYQLFFLHAHKNVTDVN